MSRTRTTDRYISKNRSGYIREEKNKEFFIFPRLTKLKYRDYFSSHVLHFAQEFVRKVKWITQLLRSSTKSIADSSSEIDLTVEV